MVTLAEHGGAQLLVQNDATCPKAMDRPASWAPCQQRALEGLLASVRTGAPLVELRSPSGRGHGVSTILRALVTALAPKAELIGISTGLGAEHPEKVLFDEATKHLHVGAVVVLDDADVATRPQRVRASRNAGDQFRGAGNFAFEDTPEPMCLLKALRDEAEKVGGTVVFSTVEEGHARYMQEPLVVRLEPARQEDIAAVLGALLPVIDVGGLLGMLPVVPSISEICLAAYRAMSSIGTGGEVSMEQLVSAVRANLGTEKAVPSEKVEHIDLSELPGMKKIQRSLETHVLFPILHPEEAKRQGLMPKRGVLLHGPPGTGKTTIGRALAHRLEGRFFMIRELLLYKEIFEVFAQARAAAPSVVFFDDIDVLLGGLNGLTEGARGHDLTRFLLSQMDGLCTTPESQVVVVMAAADAKFLPPAILRSGRIELWLQMEKPKPRERKAMLQQYVDKAQRTAAADSAELLRAPLDLDEVAQLCEDFVPADLKRLVSDARNVAAAGSATKSGGAYLKEAASDLRSMKEEVEGILGRRMYA